MADQEKYGRMLQRTMDLQTSPIGTAPICKPVQDPLRVVIQRPMQDVPDKGGRWKKFWSFLTNIPILNPLAKVARRWNQILAISCLIAIFIDPLFFFLLSMDKDKKCIVFNWNFAKALTIARTVTDAIYLLHIILQFRVAYVDPESRVLGAGDMVEEPKKVAMRYLRSAFVLDAILVLPVPQVLIWQIIPKYIGVSSANYAKNMLRATVLLQYVPRILRFLSFLGGQSASGFVFESAWANFVINLIIFLLAGHVVGSFWYLFGLQSLNQCLRNACVALNITSCAEFMDCAYDINGLDRGKMQLWFNNSMSQSCFDTTGGSFKYGIYEQVVLLTAEPSVNRYIYSLFWGFQQISTLAGNLVPSYFVWEVLFTKAIIVLGLLLFALLIANMQNFLQSLGKRNLEMQLRRYDVEKWMSHRQLPEDLRRRVRSAERYSWIATRGVNEEVLLSKLPEDIQRDIRFFRSLHKIRLFTLKDCAFTEAIRDKLKQKLYKSGTYIVSRGHPVNNILFVVRGKLEIISADGSKSSFNEEEPVCGAEILDWYLEQSLVNRDDANLKVQWTAESTIKCLTDVEAFVLQASHLEEAISQFSTSFRNPLVAAAIRYHSQTWRTVAASDIQRAWRYRRWYRQWQLRRAEALEV